MPASAIGVMRAARNLSDASFRVLAALETVCPADALEFSLPISKIGELLPTNYSGVHLSLAELEFQGWIRARTTAGRVVVDLVYRRN